jgi:hypothetical protein
VEQSRIRRGEERGGASRRGVVLGAATLAAGATAGRAWSGETRGFDTSTPAAQSLAFRKLAYSTDGKTGFWWLHGRRYGLVDGDLTPFWDMHVGSWFSTHSLEGGDYAATTISVSVYTDCATGEVLEDFVNPYTGRRVRIAHFPPTPSRAIYGPSGRRATPGSAPPGLAAKTAIGPAWVQGDRVYVSEDVSLAGALVSDPATRVRVNDLTTYVGLVRDVLDPAIAMAPAEQMFNDDNTWPAWLDMDGAPGSYFSRAWGRKVFRWDDMPPLWRAVVARLYPSLARDPVGALAG